MVMLVTRNLSVMLGHRRILDGIDLDFAPGALIGVVGPNGAGKSTLVRALTGLIAYSGSIALDGCEASTIARRERARATAYLPQGQTLHWPLTVDRLVQLGRLPHLGPLSRIVDVDRAAIERAMVRADVLTLRDRIATELSGGERARAMLARALAVEAPILIADEPLAALDPLHQFEVMELLAAEAAAGRTVIAVLHDLAMAARYCSRIVMIEHGRVVADDRPVAVLGSQRLAAVYGIRAEMDWRGDVPRLALLGRLQDPG
ncbi:ABC transporter ATP-binding protein [Sphingomonas turrisvirgatae]|uniref:ABC transporter n=1 Tax=Sphingomonas turrisvirgatae TaxID=1888892 RepID=A0A1E3LW22_9SPHN|nr:ABC transporter ATP-binding protein [Sphingomonas turrisvirgatae]ODP37972.1 ABC transporter [Sphingomonas turrisvirgatae]